MLGWHAFLEMEGPQLLALPPCFTGQGRGEHGAFAGRNLCPFLGGSQRKSTLLLSAARRFHSVAKAVMNSETASGCVRSGEGDANWISYTNRLIYDSSGIRSARWAVIIYLSLVRTVGVAMAVAVSIANLEFTAVALRRRMSKERDGSPDLVRLGSTATTLAALQKLPRAKVLAGRQS